MTMLRRSMTLGLFACAASQHAPPDPAACTDAPLDLLATRWQGAPTALYVPATWDDAAVALHLDSASAYTVLFVEGEPAGWVDDAGTVTVGCDTLTLPGYRGLGQLPDVRGRAVVGMAGADWLLRSPVDLDIRGAELRRFATAPATWETAPWVTYDLVGGEMLVDATFDGRPVRLVVDTGAAHAVWLGEAPEPGDVEVTTEDALGDPLTVWQGSAEIGLAGEAWEATMLRAERFPVLEAVSAQLGVPLDGLLGLSAFPGGRIYLDPASQRLYLPP